MKKLSISLLLFGAVLASSLPALAQNAPTATTGVIVTLGDITDNRTTGQFFSGLKAEFKVSGDAVYDANGIGKPKFSVAKDDTGRSLIKEEKSETLLWDMQTRRQKSNNEKVDGELANPARKATSMTLKGVIPVYAPSLDPASVVTLPDISAVYGKPMTSGDMSVTVLDKTSAEAFAKARAEEKKAQTAAAGAALNMAFGSMFGMGGVRDNDVQFRIKDPSGHLARIEIVGADGKVIETNGRSKSSSDGEDTYSYNFNSPLPKGTALRIYYATAKSMLEVPFNFENVPLP